MKVTWADSYTGHSARHAVASALRDMQVSAAAVAAHVQVKEATLESSYYTAVVRHWEIPQDCVAKQVHLAAKLAVPYVHYISSRDGSTCACNCLLHEVEDD